MAYSAVKVWLLPPKRMLHLLIRQTPGRLSQCLTLSAACCLSILIGEIWQIPAMSTMPIILLAIWQNNRMMNIAVSQLVITLIFVVPTMLFIGVWLTVNNDFMMLFINVALAFLFFFLGSASKLSMLGPIIGLVLSYSLVTVDQVPYGDAITRLFLFFELIFIITAGIMILGALFFSPSPKTILMAQIGRRLHVAASLLRQPDHATFQEELDDLIDDGCSGMLLELALSGKEKIWNPGDLSALRQASLHSFAILVTIRSLCRPQNPDEEKLLAEPQIGQFAAVMAEMAQYFHYNAYPTHITLPPVTADASRNPALMRLAQLLEQFSEQSDEKLPQPPPRPKGFFLPDAFTNIEHTRFSVKGAACVLVCILIYKMLNWPGIHTCIITCFVVALPTMGETIAKQRLRIIGALIGCMLSGLMIVFLMPHMTNIGQLMLVFGTIIALGGWIKCGDPRISYGGFQIVLAFFLSALSQFTPATDLTVPRDRVIGILIGLTVTYLVFTRIWPRSSNNNIAAQFDTIKTLLRQENEAEIPLLRLFFAAKIQETIAATKHIIENAVREPPGYRPTGDQLQTYYDSLENASSLMGDIVLSPRSPADPLLSDPRFDLLTCTARP